MNQCREHGSAFLREGPVPRGNSYSDSAQIGVPPSLFAALGATIKSGARIGQTTQLGCSLDLSRLRCWVPECARKWSKGRFSGPRCGATLLAFRRSMLLRRALPGD